MKGKCKKDFEKWYTNTIRKELQYRELRRFHDLQPSMQYGVIVDFFDSVRIYLSIERGWSVIGDCYDGYDYIIGVQYLGTADTRHEAREAAIEKATEIYNEKFADTK